MRSKYDVWLDALVGAYTAQRYGIDIGAPYAEVLKWMPTMRPYLDRAQTSYPLYIDTVYSLTHVVLLHSERLQSLLGAAGSAPTPEFAYLEAQLARSPSHSTIRKPWARFLDSLSSFGLTTSDQEIRTGIAYLLDTQRPDGTWSPADEKDPYTLYHSAWTGIDGLKDCRWTGQGLSFPELRPLLEKMR